MLRPSLLLKLVPGALVALLLAVVLFAPSTEPRRAEALGAASVDAGGTHTCTVTAAGAAKCWGDNTNGELGDGTTLDRTSPVAVSGLSSGVDGIAAGGKHSCALLAAGGVKCWGANGNGQLGNGTMTPSTTPVDVTGLSTAVAITAGEYHTCALLKAGGLKCWGYNAVGQLGNGGGPDSSTPVDVTGLTSGVSAVSAGDYDTCALTTGGGVKCWGINTYGQLGDGTTTNKSTATDVTGLTSGVAQVSAGGDGTGAGHTCAVTTGGGVKCWGYNANGELGDGTTTNSSTPVDMSFVSNIASVSAGGYHTCLVTADNYLECAGYNANGQLGDGTTTSSSLVVAVTALAGIAETVSGGLYHTCALTTAGAVKCWGRNADGELGDGTTTSSSTPVDVPFVAAPAASAVSVGALHACALTTGGGVKCWGYNAVGQLGNGTLADSSTPVDVSGLGSGVAAVSTGDYHTCALTTGGGVKCWGYNSDGQLGNGTTTNSSTPVDVTGLTSGVAAVSAGGGSTCALTTGGGLKCWGGNQNGQLGDGTTTGRSTPVDVSGLTSGVAAVSAGERESTPSAAHTCALTTGGGLKCWGGNQNGQLGDGTTTDRSAPVQVTGLTSGVAAVSTGNRHTCALTTGGGVKCWGGNENGQLGTGTLVSSSTPVDVSGLTAGVTAMSAGSAHTCALTTGGGVKCWGNNFSGQLGNGGTMSQNPTPVDTVATSGLGDINAGPFSTCGVAAGGVKCWGQNNYGQLGNGTTTNSSRPVGALGLEPPDTDGDGCTDDAEGATLAGNELYGGRRNYKDRWDYFNPSGDRLNRVDDILLVVQAYFDDLGTPGYNPDMDRTLAGPQEWNLGPPNGLQRVDDILNSVKQYFHDCA